MRTSELVRDSGGPLALAFDLHDVMRSKPSGQPLLGGGRTRDSSIADPAGDVTHKGPAYLDVVGASVTKQGQTFVFRKDLAAPIPQDIGHVPPETTNSGGPGGSTPTRTQLRQAFPARLNSPRLKA